MIISVWRYAHLALAIVSFSFIMMASITGVILSFEPISEKANQYKASNFDEITLTDAIKNLKQKYPELMKLNVDSHQFVTIEGFDEDGNDFKHIVHPLTGEVLGKPLEKTAFMQWVTTLHRSLFLHNTGRFIVGIFCFLLLLITITGTILLIKRQKGIRNFFSKIHKDSLPQYYHTTVGRLLLLPIFVITITGTYLFLLRFEVIQSEEIPTMDIPTIDIGKPIDIKDYPAFQNVYLSEIKEIEFPFDDSPEEFYKIKTSKGEWLIDQVKGEKIQEIQYPLTKTLETLSLDLHTGRTNILWAIVLGLSSLNILAFIYTGFAITLKRKSFRAVKNTISDNDAEIVLLVGSESGSTWAFAQKVHQQLIQAGSKVYTTQLNRYKAFPKVQQMIILTSTYGQGDAPSNANKFHQLLKNQPQNREVQYSVVGFGSRSYEDFCGFAVEVSQLLSGQEWAKPMFQDIFVNNRSAEDFCEWVELYNEKYGKKLSNNPSFYKLKMPKLEQFEVLLNKEADERDDIFMLQLKGNKNSFNSGDLLAIYPENNHKERLYSIAKIDGKVQLVVKRHPKGLGSQFLYQSKVSQKIKARIIENKNFHKPKNKPTLFISNGTGVAPFLGMIAENNTQNHCYLYAGFRYKTENIVNILSFIREQEKLGKITRHSFAFSREETQQYITDLLKQDADFIANFLENGGVIMVCGSLSMWKDVEKLLEDILSPKQQDVSFYKQNGQILTDCY